MAVSLQWMFEAEERGTVALARLTATRDVGVLLLSAVYLATAALSAARGHPPPVGAVLTLVLLPVVAGSAALWHATRRDRLSAYVRAGWPLVAAPQVYLAEVRVVELQDGRYHDHLLSAVDALLGLARGGEPVLPLGGPLEELANAAYASYWLIPLLVLVISARGGPWAVAKATTALALTSVACGLLWLAVPTGGYHALGSPQGPAYGPFTAFVHEVYAVQPHFAAAFPSEHVGHAAAMAWVMRTFGTGWWIWLWVGGVAASTVVGQYHFASDAAVGWIVGVGGGVLAGYLAEQASA